MSHELAKQKEGPDPELSQLESPTASDIEMPTASGIPDNHPPEEAVGQNLSPKQVGSTASSKSNKSDARKSVRPNKQQPGDKAANEDDTMFVVVHCLGCNVETQVDVDRLDRKFQCKKCGTKMYMDTLGTWRRGIPPKMNDADSVFRALIEEHRSGLWKRLWGKLSNTQQKIVLMLAAGMVVTLLVLIVQSIIFRASVQIPDKLEGRGRFAFDAMLEGNVDFFKMVTTRSTREQALEWFTASRNRLGAKQPNQKLTVDFKVKKLFEDVKGGKGGVVGTFKIQASNRDTKDKKQTQSSDEPKFSEDNLVIFWLLSGGEWVIDGKRTADSR